MLESDLLKAFDLIDDNDNWLRQCKKIEIQNVINPNFQIGEPCILITSTYMRW